MANWYPSYEEDESYRDGKRDARYGREDVWRDKHAHDGVDKAYYDGHKEETEERQREERALQEEEEWREEERRRNQRRQLDEEEEY